ncbi:GntR family transcriptional regulator [Leucobacter sp. CSA2]|uniref:GntR family transcriptional regulator n=1 Tax=Leucobacter edaphi TaxID=2796472 RepID=A0A934QCX5_9MICO|nr:GntR family transcriptional regulator [Leucobacter edaphi]MBK0420757.1 GntR family transcriptional regulator [Leucobacter edaphi]
MSSSTPNRPEPEAQLTPLDRPRNLRETVLDQLRTAIITGRLEEGEIVSAPVLGQALGVSATPVREAMMDLAREGLVETLKNKGFRITSMSEKDLDDLAQIRVLLEPPAMRLVAGNIPDEDIAGLQALADDCLRAAETEDLERYLRDDREFHAQILSYANNPQLTELATSLRTRTRLYGIGLLASQGRLSTTASEHQTLIDLLVAGDGEAAVELLRQHISHARDVWATGDTTDGQDPDPDRPREE